MLKELPPETHRQLFWGGFEASPVESKCAEDIENNFETIIFFNR